MICLLSLVFVNYCFVDVPVAFVLAVVGDVAAAVVVAVVLVLVVVVVVVVAGAG